MRFLVNLDAPALLKASKMHFDRFRLNNDLSPSLLMSATPIHLITFADGRPDLRAAAERLAKQADETGWFSSVAAWHLEHLQHRVPTWVQEHHEFIRNHQRGFGYWIWKPRMIFERLKALPMNSFLVALDSGYEISPMGKVRFDQYIEMAAGYDLLGFEIRENIGKWTKGDLLSYLDVPLHSPLLEDNQIQSGLLIIKKNYANLLFLSHWAELITAHNYTLVDDSPSASPNPVNFSEHRHDQAILTLLARLGKVGYFPESEDYYPDLLKQGKFNAQFPFQCFRNKTGTRLIPAPPYVR